MMDKDEAVKKLANVARISVAYAEDLYDSFLPKPVIPYYIADYIEEVKSEGDLTVVGAVNEAPDGEVRDWLFLEKVNTFAKAWVNGYEVEKETRYQVTFKDFASNFRVLKYHLQFKNWFTGNDSKYDHTRMYHTRKELEDAGFGWLFNCEGIEIEEVE